MVTEPVHWNEVSKEGAINAFNSTFDKAKTTLKRIARPHAFVENEQWSAVRMKEEFHARFVAILRILYSKKWLTYINN